LRYYSADRDPEPELEVIRDESLPSPQIVGLWTSGAGQAHPPCKGRLPILEQGVVGHRWTPAKPKPTVTSHQFSQLSKHGKPIFRAG
jgi:hypothetical protein